MAAIIPEFLFHVTPAGNLRSILDYGIDPRRKYPERVGTRSFYVEENQLMWALAHMSARHVLPVTKLAVLRMNAYPEARIQRYKKIGFLPGVYYTDIAGFLSQYEAVIGSKITAWYENGGGEINKDLWQLTEDGGLG